MTEQADQGSVAVLGGGLAGMTAAFRLANRGHAVTLIERRPYLGGRAYSFTDADTGQQVDNGQHVFLGCNTEYIRLLRDLGTLERTSRQRRLRIEVRSPGGKTGVLAGRPLPVPLHLLDSLARYPHLSWFEKLLAVPALLRMRSDRHRDRPGLQTQSFGSWLRRNKQSAHAIANFWDLIIVPSLNDHADDVSASMGFMVFQEALLKTNSGANVGYARSGLSDLMGTPMAEKLASLGVDVKLGRTVESIAIGDDGRVESVALAVGESVKSDSYVSALPPDVLREALPKSTQARADLEAAANHTWAPIVNLHIWYDRPVADFDFAAFVDSPVQWVFNKTRIASLPGPGQYLTVSLSAAWEYWPMSKDELRGLFIPALADAIPAATAATVERFIVVKEQRATFRSLPGIADNRPPATTDIPNLFLAGDWTATGWPSTMESAVRSGNNAANAIANSGIGA